MSSSLHAWRQIEFIKTTHMRCLRCGCHYLRAVVRVERGAPKETRWYLVEPGGAVTHMNNRTIPPCRAATWTDTATD